MKLLPLLLGFALAVTVAPLAGADRSASDVLSAIQTILQVGPEGSGNAAASPAWQGLSRARADALLPILKAMDDANELAANWLRSAVDTIADRELKAGQPLPKSQLLAFLHDTKHHPRARRLAFELVQRLDPVEAARLVPGFLNDPSVELRRDAVQEVMNTAAKGLAARETEQASQRYSRALNHARDEDQIKTIAAALRELGEKVDLPRHFGFLTHWKVIGPFDNTDLRGFQTAYPPEEKVDLNAEYDGKLGKVRWQDHVTSHDYGILDLNGPLGTHKGVTGYAWTEFNAAEAQPAELRLGCKNGWKVWFNGKLLFGRDEYHRGARIDQYRLPVELQAGRNTILVKVCQNEDVKDWTKEWEFQLRVCNATGTAILARDRPPTPVTPARRADSK